MRSVRRGMGMRHKTTARKDDLRRQAEQRVVQQPMLEEPAASTDKDRLIYELHVHQAELEIQNEELREAQFELEESHKQYADLYDYAPIGYLTLHRDGRIKQANLKAADMLGIHRDRLLRRIFLQFVPKEDWDTYSAHLQSVLKTGLLQQCDLRLQPRQGPLLHVHMQSLAEDNNRLERSRYFRTALIDITQRKQAEETIHQLNTSLEQRVHERTAELRATNEELETFAYSISHDLRSPLQHIIAFESLLKQALKEPLNPEIADYLKNIETASSRMAALIEGLLKYLRLGKTEISPHEVDLQSVVQEAIAELAHRTVGRRIDWKIDALPKVSGDLTMLRQVLSNLIDNAVKFTRPREVAQIEIGSQLQANNWVIFIRDNGVGFDMAYQSKIYGVFQRLHQGSQFEGTGVGLAIVQRILKLHGGRIYAESVENQGSTFYVSLPRQAEALTGEPLRKTGS